MTINYPIKRPPSTKIVSSSNRGMNLEEAINQTNEYYLLHDIAVIYKKPTPIQVVSVDYPMRNKAKITEAYYKTPSTTDYNGLYQGKYIDFEVKETNSLTSFPLSNIHPHQIEHLRRVQAHGGIGFLLVSFNKLGFFFLFPLSSLFEAWDHLDIRKSIPLETFKEKGYIIKEGAFPRLNY